MEVTEYPFGKSMMLLCVKDTLISSDFRIVENEFELVTAALEYLSNISGLDEIHLSLATALNSIFLMIYQSLMQCCLWLVDTR